MEKIHLQSKTKINQYFPISQQIKELYQLNPPTTKYEQMPFEKINAYKDVLNHNKEYLNIHSHYQFQSIIDDYLKHNNLDDLERLISLIAEKKSTNDKKKIFEMLLVNGKPDVYFYNLIGNLPNKKIKNKILGIGRFIYLKLLPIIYQLNLKIENYLDIGCGDGYRTKQIGKLIKAKNVIGADIPNWFPYNHKNMKNMKYVEINEKKTINLPDNKFDLITCIHTLHHWKNINIRINDIKRLLRKNGVLVLVEHDALTKNDHSLIDIEHGIYEISIEQNLMFYDQYYAKYFNFIELKMMFEKEGFSLLSQSYFDSGSIKQKIKPTRTLVLTFIKKN